MEGSSDGDRLTKAQQSALHRVGGLLTHTDIPWAITGSIAFAMRGVDVVPHDLDIQTDAAGAYAIERLLVPHMVWPVRYRTAPAIRSHFGRAVVADVSVDIMGAIEKRRPDDTWMSVDLPALIEGLEWAGQVWPVLPLAYEAAAYRALGRHGTADHLEQWRAHKAVQQGEGLT